MPIPQWTVQDPHSARLSNFEDQGKAWAYAATVAQADAPAVLRCPDGDTHPGTAYIVLRYSEIVEVSTRHRLVGTTRRVVEL